MLRNYFFLAEIARNLKAHVRFGHFLIHSANRMGTVVLYFEWLPKGLNKMI